jgi:hypothetical protein
VLYNIKCVYVCVRETTCVACNSIRLNDMNESPALQHQQVEENKNEVCCKDGIVMGQIVTNGKGGRIVPRTVGPEKET